jgi:phage terminase large subunit-like protein
MMGEGEHIEDPTSDYARAVLAGEIMAGQLARRACQRHLDDLDHGGDRGLYFDLKTAARAIKFFGFLRHTEGQFAGKRFDLMPFQKFITGSVFGWKNRSGFRRFRTAYNEIGKGNGKTPLAAGIGLLGLLADTEPGAQVYAAAVTRDQANLSFTDAENMAKGSPELSQRVEFNVGNMAVLATRSYFRPLSSEHRALSGQRVHIAIIDELHEHPNASVVDKIRAGTKARRQALIFEITNSGYDRNSVCFAHHEYSVKILQGVLEDDSWFAYICQLDPCAKCAAAGREAPNEDCADCDDWRDERVSIKANPGLDVILPRQYLREQVREAIGMPTKQNIVRRLNFCQWTEQAVRWIPMSDWDACPKTIDLTRLVGRPCYGGVDLSTRLDLTAFVKVFPPTDQDPDWVWLCRFFVPRDNVRDRERRDRVPYSAWIKAGFIEATEGDVVDYNVIEERIIEDSKVFSIEEIGFDPWNATQFGTNLISKGFKMVETRQGPLTFNEPCKDLEARIRSHHVNHGGNPVLRWNASNVSVHQDRNANLSPDKERSTERIDGIVAGLIAMARAIRNGNGGSVYESRGILRLVDL